LSNIVIKGIEPYFKTKFGQAYLCDTVELLKVMDDNSIDLIITSPPFALIRKKRYGNESSSEYIEWFINNFAHEFKRILKPTGSLVIDIGGTWIKGSPTRSLYHFELLLELCKKDDNSPGFHLAQEFYWYNPAKLPTPAQWVNIERIRVKDAVNPVWWLSKEERPKANNRNVLTPYKKSMKKLLKDGYNHGPRPSGHNVSQVWGRDNGGAIPPNLLEIANTSSKDRYLEACRKLKLKPHPARFPKELPAFFIKFLTDPGDVVFDPFGGSCVTGEVAEELGRYWITSEIVEEYVYGSQFRFFDLPQEQIKESQEDNKTLVGKS